MSNTNENPTTGPYIPRAGATLPGPLQPACNRERVGATPGPVLPPNPPLPRAGSTGGRANGPAKHAGPRAGLMTTKMLSNNRPEYYLPSRAYRDTCTAGTGAHLLQNVQRLGRRGGFGTYNLHEIYEGHTPRRKLTASMSGRGAATLPGIPILRNPTRGTRGTTGSPQGPTPSPASRHGCVTPSPAHHAGRNVPAPQHEPKCPNHPNDQAQHCDTGTPAT